MPSASPYRTALAFGRVPPTHIPEDAVADVGRVTAYETYDDIFHNIPDIFKAVLNEQSGNEIFRRLVPAMRTIIEATNRYLGNGLDWVAAPPVAATATAPTGDAANAAADEAIATTIGALDLLFAREAFVGKFMSLKRWMLIRGDGMFHVTANPSKPEGARLSIREINPGTYFAIEDPADAERVVGCYVVNLIADDAGEEIAARLEYQRITDADAAAKYGAPLNTVFMKLSFWEPDGWDDRRSDADLSPVAAPARFGGDAFALLLAGTTLPPQITAIPIYHFRNNPRGGEIFGVSEVQGIESLLAGISQTVTDQEVAIALQGLGVYWTDSGRPKDASGADADWVIGPAAVLEVVKDGKIGRLDGISSITPSLDHIALLKAEARETTGTPDIAVGAVDVKVAESGVSRAIQFAPIIAKNAEKEVELKSRLDQFLYDLLTGWLPAYDGYTDNGVRVTAEFGPALPVNASEIVELLASLVEKKIVSAEWARDFLTEKLGWTFESTEGGAIAAEAQALLDPTGARLDEADDAAFGA
jgi:hypothetical protein